MAAVPNDDPLPDALPPLPPGHCSPAGTNELVELYIHLRTFESNFDQSQGQIRAIASAWVIAAVGALGYLATAKYSAQPLPTEIIYLLLQGVCLIAALGLVALWYLDQGVYQRLLHTVFAYGMKLEAWYPWLPQLRRSMYKASLDITGPLGWLYRAPILLFAVIGAAVLAAALLDLPPRFGSPAELGGLTYAPHRWSLLQILVAAAQLAACALGLVGSRRWPSLPDMLPPKLRGELADPPKPPSPKPAIPPPASTA